MPLNKENAIFERAPLLTGRTQIEGSTNQGFNTTDFEVDANNVVNLKNKTSYYSIDPADWTTEGPDTDQIYIRQVVSSAEHDVYARADNIFMMAPIHLPHGAVVTSIIIYGNDVGKTWYLYRTPLNTPASPETLATAAFNAADTTITTGTIDNQNYCYHVGTNDMDTGDIIFGGTIAYTTDYD